MRLITKKVTYHAVALLCVKFTVTTDSTQRITYTIGGMNMEITIQLNASYIQYTAF